MPEAITLPSEVGHISEMSRRGQSKIAQRFIAG